MKNVLIAIFFLFCCRQVLALSLDSLIEDSEKTQGKTRDVPTSQPSEGSPKASLSLDSMMSEGADDGVSAGFSLDNIYQDRSKYQLVSSKERLALLNKQLSKDCSCSLTSKFCYNLTPGALNLTQSSVISAAKEADTILTQQAKTICKGWQGSKGFTSNDAEKMQQQVSITERYQSLLQEVNKASQDMVVKLKNQNQRIENQIAQQQESSGFDWGKAFAMGVGAMAGGLGHLDVDSQTKIIGSIIQDSYSGDSSMNNLQSTVNSLNAQMKQVSSSSGVGHSGSSDGATSFKIDYTYTDSCPAPSTTKINAPIKTNIQACADAMERYAKAASCNLVDDLESAQKGYYQACASEMYQ